MMKHAEQIVRQAEELDMPQLKALWKTVFGDDDTDIDHFFGTWFSPDLTVVISDGTKAVSAAYILPAGRLVFARHDGESLDCAMLYAIGTLPEYRGHGYGAMITRAALRLATQKGYPAVVLKPANDGLFEFYERHSEFRAFFNVFEAEFTAGALPRPDSGYKLSPVSPAEYRTLRQRLLNGVTYIDMDERGLSYLHYLTAKAGGGFFKLLYDGVCTGCAAIEPEDGTIGIKELLLQDGCQMVDAVAAAAALLPAKRYIVRTPPGSANSQTRFGMLASIDGRTADIMSVHSAKWYGFAFD